MCYVNGFVLFLLLMWVCVCMHACVCVCAGVEGVTFLHHEWLQRLNTICHMTKKKTRPHTKPRLLTKKTTQAKYLVAPPSMNQLAATAVINAQRYLRHQAVLE